MQENPSKKELFGSLDIQNLTNNPDFKEDSVREVIILPILKALGFSNENIIRSKSLKHPFLKVGSNKKIEVKLIPDYILKVENNYAWVLDAKAPNQKILSEDAIYQVYSYATHPEIRSTFFALCNGIEWVIFRTEHPEKPVLYFPITEIEEHWQSLKMLLAPSSFQVGKNITYEVLNPITKYKTEFDYANRPLLEEIPVKKQATARHFGVHGYFTKQTWNVVQEYIKNFSKPGDLVLDPFGGSGITAIEALMCNRRAIHIDINPFANFIVEGLIAPVDLEEFSQVYEKISKEYEKLEPQTEDEIQKALKKYPKPKPLPLPKGSDVPTVDKLFSPKQTAQLGLLKSLIKKYTQHNENLRKTFMLMFSGLVTRMNLTYHVSKAVKANTGFGGDAAAFRYYRYRIAPKPTEIDLLKGFYSRFKKVLKAKKEIEYFINPETIEYIQIRKGSATNLKFLPRESVDYIYTDPPYGKKIPYLDLSAMWVAWLDLDITEDDYALEAIEGGERNKGKDEYNRLIAESIKEMYRVLKFDRWLSFVFAHKDPEFWHLIIDTAESCGFEYVGAVPQKNGQTSFKKRQNPFTVLSGQLIINFRKTQNPKAIMKAHLGMDISQIVMQTIEGIIAKNNGASLEQINDELIIKGLELGFLDLLKKEYSDLTPILLNHFDYNEQTELFTLKPNAQFKTHVDVKLRIRYYLISYLRRMEREKKNPSFDEIVMNIMPLLKNGATPENQTILTVVKDTCIQTEDGGWKLRPEGGQQSLFD